MAQWIVIGIMMTTTGVLFMNADAKITNAASTASINMGWTLPIFVTQVVNAARAPVRRRAADKMNMAAMVQGAGLENTWSAFA